jgi:uncharacterized protein (TIGR02996 family)
MSEREARLRAICEQPDEDTPRLVFADWLQENGQPEYAEFVRAQVRHAELLRDASPDTNGLAQRARDLWVRYGERWRAELPQVNGLVWHDAFFRGFVERAVVSTDAVLVRDADAIFNFAPVRHVVVRQFVGHEGFAALRGLSRLKTLTLFSHQPSRKAVEELLRCDTLADSALLICTFD